jgi:hypothetical protein
LVLVNTVASHDATLEAPPSDFTIFPEQITGTALPKMASDSGASQATVLEDDIVTSTADAIRIFYMQLSVAPETRDVFTPKTT